MAKPSGHMTADAAGDQDGPEQGDGQVRDKVDQPGQADVQDAEKAFATMRPAVVVLEFKQHQDASAGKRQMMPGQQGGKQG